MRLPLHDAMEGKVSERESELASGYVRGNTKGQWVRTKAQNSDKL
jgi:hypothetical protein